MEYLVKHKNINVARINIDEYVHEIDNIIDIFDEERLPVPLLGESPTADIKNLNYWLKSRGIPQNREDIENSLKVLYVKDATALSLLSYGLNLTDQYWVCPADKDTDWHKINFFENNFSRDVGNVLFDNIAVNNPNLFSPDSTLNGNLKKRWKISGNKRILLKGGSNSRNPEPFNEAIASIIMDRLGIHHVRYGVAEKSVSLENGAEIKKYYSTCDCMVNADTEFLSAHYVYRLFNDRERTGKYADFISICEKKGIENAKAEIDKMIGVDYIIANTDRHHGNFGIIRNADTLQWLSLVPIFDCGNSLWHGAHDINEINAAFKTKSRAFDDSNEIQINRITDFSWFDRRKLTDIGAMFDNLLRHNRYINDSWRERLCASLNQRVKMFHDYKMTRELGPTRKIVSPRKKRPSPDAGLER